jgi:hypothetical protein
MQIIDKGQMFPDHATIRRVVAGHPFHPGLDKLIAVFQIVTNSEIGASRASISYDSASRTVILSLTTPMPMNLHTEYVLLHELTRVIDRENPAFHFAESEKNALTSREHWRFMDLWNLLIDARLNALGHFVLEESRPRQNCTIVQKGEDNAYGIERKLLDHINSLRSTGLVDAETTVREVWAKPSSVVNFNDLVAVAKK